MIVMDEAGRSDSGAADGARLPVAMQKRAKRARLIRTGERLSLRRESLRSTVCLSEETTAAGRRLKGKANRVALERQKRRWIECMSG